MTSFAFCLLYFYSFSFPFHDHLLFISFLLLPAYFSFTGVHFNPIPYLTTKRGKDFEGMGGKGLLSWKVVERDLMSLF